MKTFSVAVLSAALAIASPTYSETGVPPQNTDIPRALLAKQGSGAGGVHPIQPGVSSVSMTDGDWVAVPPPHGRFRHAMVYDPIRDRLLVFGGVRSAGSSGPYLNDTWEIDPDLPPYWALVQTAGPSPEPRAGHSGIYDAVNDRIIVFGGHNTQHYLNDVWALSLSGPPTWSQIIPTGSRPVIRRDHTAVYDPIGERMIVFGGVAGTTRLNDTWELSLAGSPTWTRLYPGGAVPSGRYGHEAIYDPIGQQMVIFGGADATGFLDETWTLTLSGSMTWTQQAIPGTIPTTRYEPAMDYDPVGHQVILFGGYDGYHRSDTWALSLDSPMTWTRLWPAWKPTARTGAKAIYVPTTNAFTMTGGFYTFYYDEIFWDIQSLSLNPDTTWTTISNPERPVFGEALAEHSTVVDVQNNRMILYGGNGGSETWLCDFNSEMTWNWLGYGPYGRYGHSAVYDSQRQQMIVFGGYHGCVSPGCWLNDTEVLTLGGTPTWSELVPVGTPPTRRQEHAAIYDAMRDRMIVFGGANDSTRFNDVWELTLESPEAWNELHPTGNPPPVLYQHTAIYDPIRDRMIVHGGQGETGVTNNTWELSLSGAPQWQQLFTGGAAPTLSQHTAIYDPVRDRMVVYGGANVWALSLAPGETWTQLSPGGTAPPSRWSHTAVYDPSLDQMVVYAGSSFNDIWVLCWGTPLSVADDKPTVSQLVVRSAYPNPARAGTTIEFEIQAQAQVSCRVYDITGRLVRTILEAPLPSGLHQARWDGRTLQGGRAPAGIYFYQVEIGQEAAGGKVVLLK